MNKNERFFGLHFDFHARNEIEVGTRTNKEDIEWFIEQARPEFIQCDCKGHRGNCSYPTKVGNPAAKLRSDNLKIWCEAIHAHDIPVYVHYSGVIDYDYTAKHKESAAYDENGECTGSTSVFGEYYKELLIPQLKELIDWYGVDGVWADGEVWGVKCDYSECADSYIGHPVSKQERNRICREGFKRYLKKCVDEIHAYKPDFKYISNWAFSSYMPEKCDVDLDFLSGDFDPVDSVYSARFEGRCLAAQNKPWDLMSWNCSVDYTSKRICHTQKSAIQIMREAAVVLALGGGFQLYITQNLDGSAPRVNSDRYRKIGDFVHSRRLNFGKTTKAQVGILYSAEARYKNSDVFNPEGADDTVKGILNCVLDTGYTSEIIFEYQLDSLIKYDIIIVPNWNLSEKSVCELLRYSQQGGHLVVSGCEPCTVFGEKIGLSFKTSESEYTYLMNNDNIFAEFYGSCADLENGYDMIYSAADNRDGIMPAYRTEKYGKGEICFIPFDIGMNYYNASSFVVRDYTEKILLSLCQPFVSVNCLGIDITVQTDGENTFINLINMNESSRGFKYSTYDFIPPFYNVEVTIRKKCDHIRMPYGENFTFQDIEDGMMIKIEKLNIHSLIVLGNE